MEVLQKRKRVVNTAYTKWTEAEKTVLIETRIKMDHLFTGKNANQRDGWITVSKELHKPTQICRHQWQSLMRKYKAICDGHSGDGANDDGPTYDPSTWPFYEIINSYASQKHNYHPEQLLSNLEGRQTSVREASLLDSTPSPSLDANILAQNRPGTSRSSSSSSYNQEDLSLFEIKILKQNKKLTKKVGSMMSVLGQMVKHDYPSIDVSQLLVESDSSDD